MMHVLLGQWCNRVSEVLKNFGQCLSTGDSCDIITDQKLVYTELATPAQVGTRSRCQGAYKIILCVILILFQAVEVWEWPGIKPDTSSKMHMAQTAFVFVPK